MPASQKRAKKKKSRSGKWTAKIARGWRGPATPTRCSRRSQWRVRRVFSHPSIDTWLSRCGKANPARLDCQYVFCFAEIERRVASGDRNVGKFSGARSRASAATHSRCVRASVMHFAHAAVDRAAMQFARPSRAIEIARMRGAICSFSFDARVIARAAIDAVARREARAHDVAAQRTMPRDNVPGRDCRRAQRGPMTRPGRLEKSDRRNGAADPAGPSATTVRGSAPGPGLAATRHLRDSCRRRKCDREVAQSAASRRERATRTPKNSGGAGTSPRCHSRNRARPFASSSATCAPSLRLAIGTAVRRRRCVLRGDTRRRTAARDEWRAHLRAQERKGAAW